MDKELFLTLEKEFDNPDYKNSYYANIFYLFTYKDNPDVINLCLSCEYETIQMDLTKDQITELRDSLNEILQNF